jgi:hypothetical protein
MMASDVVAPMSLDIRSIRSHYFVIEARPMPTQVINSREAIEFCRIISACVCRQFTRRVTDRQVHVERAISSRTLVVRDF